MLIQGDKRDSTMVTSNSPSQEWAEASGSEGLTGPLLDLLTRQVRILEMNGDSDRLKQSRRKRAASVAPATYFKRTSGEKGRICYAPAALLPREFLPDPCSTCRHLLHGSGQLVLCPWQRPTHLRKTHYVPRFLIVSRQQSRDRHSLPSRKCTPAKRFTHSSACGSLPPPSSISAAQLQVEQSQLI